MYLWKGFLIVMNYEAIAVTVSDLNLYIKDKFVSDEALNAVVVKGEISNFKAHYTGHLYFTLKDDKSLIKCVMFKSYCQNINFKPKDGMKIIVFGGVSVFERDGIYQIYVKAMQEQGVGELYAAYEKLKNDLEQEGLFKDSHKKKIPLNPKIIGVLTSETGAVIRDIINVSTRRNPNCYIRLLPVPVQGPTACKQIVRAIKIMNENKLADVIILARGGGSLEDLWPFNEENVARAIYDSDIPIISAVGHETDFTIADFVADLRAPTPSAAAELANIDSYETKNKINILKERLRNSINKKVEILKLKYSNLMENQAMVRPLQNVQSNYLLVDNYIKQMVRVINIKQKEAQIEFETKISKLDALSPLKTLARGYTIIEKNGKIVKNAEKLRCGDIVGLKFAEGQKNAKIL